MSRGEVLRIKSDGHCEFTYNGLELWFVPWQQNYYIIDPKSNELVTYTTHGLRDAYKLIGKRYPY